MFAAFTFSLFVCQTTAVCLHKGCPMSRGLYFKDLGKEIKAFGTGGLKVLQWNILYDKKRGKDKWANRRTDVCQYINKIKPDLIGLQEVMKNQLDDLKNCLPGFEIFGEPRDDRSNSLRNPVFVNLFSNLQVLRNGTFWLSATPDKRGSRIPSSRYARICSWIKVKTKDSKKEFYVATTHLAYLAMSTALHQIDILMRHMSLSIMNDYSPLILTGDLNWESNSTIYSTLKNHNMRDSMFNANKTFPQLTALPPYQGLVDYVWTSGFKNYLSATMMDKRPNGRMLSDHRPVFALVSL